MQGRTGGWVFKKVNRKICAQKKHLKVENKQMP